MSSQTARSRRRSGEENALDLDREIEYTFDTDEPMLGRPPAGDVE
jgi:hypothetical protein